MLTLREAIEVVLKQATLMPTIRYHTTDALGLVLAEDLYSDMDLPPFDQSAMDGYALNIDEWHEGDFFSNTRQSKAGDQVELNLNHKEIIRIYTGAPLPQGANAVLIQENTSIYQDGLAGQSKSIDLLPSSWANIRKKGSDIQQGQKIFKQGHCLSAADLGLLTALGISHVYAYQKPKIAMISIGDELVPPFSQSLQYGQIYNSNLIALENQLKEIGIDQIESVHLPDAASEIYEQLKGFCAQKYDVIFTIAGASVGDFDFTTQAIEKLCGQDVFFEKVAIQPGKPMHFAKKDRSFIFALPGNPISAMVVCEMFMIPFLLKIQGHQKIFKIPELAYCVDPLPVTKQRALFLRGKAYHIDDELPDKFMEIKKEHIKYVIDIDRNQSSGALSSLANANALLFIPANTSINTQQSLVQIILLGRQPWMRSQFFI